MATDQDLLKKVIDYQRKQKDANLRLATASPGMIAQGATTGADPNQIWNSWFPQDQPDLSASEYVDARLKLQEGVNALQEARAKTGSELMDQMAGGDPALLKEMMGVFQGVQSASINQTGHLEGIRMQEKTELTKEFIQTTANLNLKHGINLLAQESGNPTYAARDDIDRDMEKMAELGHQMKMTAGEANMVNSKAVEEIGALLHSGTSPGDLALLQAAFQGSSGIPLKMFLKQNGDILAIPAETQHQLDLANQWMAVDGQQLGQFTNATFGLALIDVSKSTGVGNGFDKMAQGIIKNREAIMKAGGPDLFEIMSGKEVSPEKLQEMLDVLYRNPDGEDPTKTPDGLLETIERGQATNPTLRQLRDQIWAGNEFQEYMSTKGFGPGAEAEAWRTLIFEARQLRQKNKMEAKQIARDNKQELISGTSPAAPSAAAQLAGGGAGERPAPTPEQLKSKMEADLSAGKTEGYKYHIVVEGETPTKVVVVTPEGRFDVAWDDTEAYDKFVGPLPEEAELPELPEEEKPAEKEDPKVTTPTPRSHKLAVGQIGEGAKNILAQALTRPMDETAMLAKEFLSDKIPGAIGRGKDNKTAQSAVANMGAVEPVAPDSPWGATPGFDPMLLKKEQVKKKLFQSRE